MKVRWTDNSIRLRITPRELDALAAGELIDALLRLPGGEWSVEVIPTAQQASLAMTGSLLTISLAPQDVRRLCAPDAEGIYFRTEDEPPLRYLVEKDFPCVHPHSGEAGETPTETFSAPEGFEQRKS